MAEAHPIFNDITNGYSEAAKQRVLADPGVLEERDKYRRMPLMVAIQGKRPVLVLLLIDHRRQHDVNTRDDLGRTALHWACMFGPLSVVQALVAAGAGLSCFSSSLGTPLMCAIRYRESDIMAYLLQQPAVTHSINATSRQGHTALSLACLERQMSVVQLLLAGADPFIPAGHWAPLATANRWGDTEIAAMLRRFMCPHYTLSKARSVIDASRVIAQAQQDASGAASSTEQQRRMAVAAAAPVWLKGRVEGEETLPMIERPTAPLRYKFERVQATAAYVVGVGQEFLPDALFVELLGHLGRA
jgi:ankyrin repeat protein